MSPFKSKHILVNSRNITPVRKFGKEWRDHAGMIKQENENNMTN